MDGIDLALKVLEQRKKKISDDIKRLNAESHKKRYNANPEKERQRLRERYKRLGI